MRIYTAEVLFGMHYAEAVWSTIKGSLVADLTRLSLVEPDPSAHPDCYFGAFGALRDSAPGSDSVKVKKIVPKIIPPMSQRLSRVEHCTK
jgi:hypothetical protein